MSTRIAIAGASFAGLKAALSLSRQHEVTVIDAEPSFEWKPNIHEIISGVKRGSDLRLSRRRVVRGAGHRFVQARIESIDAPSGRVHLDTGKAIPFDACIVAAGSVHDTAGVPGAQTHALPFKTVAHCEEIHRRLRSRMRSGGEVSIAIVGGGLEGIEALGEILRRYRKRADVAMTIVEGAERLLPGAPAGLDGLVRAHCAEMPVRFRTGIRVREVRAAELRLEDGSRVAFDLCIWSAGAAAAPLLHESGLSPAPRAWAPVNADLRSTYAEAIFVAGDAAALPDPLAKQAYHALQMGEHAAVNAERLLRGRSLREFAGAAKPMLVTFGDLDTFLVLGDTALAGTGLAAVKEAVFQVTMAQLDPPTTTSALGGLGARLGHGIASILPALAPERLLRLPRVRLL